MSCRLFPKFGGNRRANVPDEYFMKLVGARGWDTYHGIKRGIHLPDLWRRHPFSSLPKVIKRPAPT